MIRFVFSLGLLFLMSSASVAETLYVTDLLRLSVTEQPQSKGKTITTLSSGDPLTVLERQPGYAKVQTPDGLSGWTKSAYLVADKPARLIVAEIQDQLEQIKEQLTQALANEKAATSDARKYKQLLQTSEKTIQQQNEQLEQIQQQNRNYVSSTREFARSIPIKIFLIAGILLFLIGILLGWYIMDYRMRKRHGGFRI
jgi:SH3 domain protein